MRRLEASLAVQKLDREKRHCFTLRAHMPGERIMEKTLEAQISLGSCAS